MVEGYLGQVKLFALNFAPKDWAQCDGQELLISQHESLYSIIGTIYGGDGRKTFALPDLRGRAPVGVGESKNLPRIYEGEKRGGAPVAVAKESEPSEVTMAGLGMTWCICLNGVFPARQ
ncbi:MAG: tail fiber protein [Chloroflexota bacterium]